MIKNILFTIFILIVLTFDSLGRITPHPFYYIHPKPQSKYHTIRTSVIIKSAENINHLEIQIRSKKHGNIDHNVTFKDAGKTMIAKPLHDFAPSDEITVNILEPVDQTPVYSFSFYTSANTSGKSSAPERTKLQKSEIQAQAKPIKMLDGYAYPGDFPDIRVFKHGETAPGKIFFGYTFGSAGNYIVILNNDGTPYFYRRLDKTHFRTGNFMAQTSELVSYYQHTPAQYNVMNKAYEMVNTYASVGYNTDNHEFILLENGNGILIGEGYETIDMSKLVEGGRKNAQVHGNHIQEIDKDGNLIWEWRSWDHYNIEDAIHERLTGSEIDYVHMNSIAFDYDGHLVVSARNLCEMSKINYQTGDFIWRMGGVNNQFAYINEDTEISYQHYIRPVPGKPDHYTIFDNGNHRDPEFSRAVEYKIDTIHMTAEKVWEYRLENNPDRFSSMMGNMQHLPGNHKFIDWSAWPPGKAIELDENNEIVFEMEIANLSSYRTTRYEWEGMLEKPEMIVEVFSSHISLIFNKFGDDSITGYNVFGDQTSDPSTLIAATTNNYLNLSDLENGKRYYFKVTATYPDGSESEFSNINDVIVNIVPPGNNQIKNGGFDKGMDFWNLSEYYDADVTAEITNEGMLKFQIGNGSNSSWHIQLLQPDIVLIKGEDYLFEFDAYAESSRLVEIKINQNSNPWTNYSRIGPTYLDTRNSHYSYAFTMEENTDPEARVEISVGGDNADIFIDNLSLKQTSNIHTRTDDPGLQDHFMIYPNPFSKKLIFDIEEAQNITDIKIYNALGKLMQSLNFNRQEPGKSTYTLQTENWEKGIYVVCVEMNTGQRAYRLLIKSGPR